MLHTQLQTAKAEDRDLFQNKDWAMKKEDLAKSPHILFLIRRKGAFNFITQWNVKRCRFIIVRKRNEHIHLVYIVIIVFFILASLFYSSVRTRCIQIAYWVYLSFQTMYMVKYAPLSFVFGELMALFFGFFNLSTWIWDLKKGFSQWLLLWHCCIHLLSQNDSFSHIDPCTFKISEHNHQGLFDCMHL